MSIFRFPEKIPTFFYLIFFFLLLGILSVVTPLISNQDIGFIISIKDETNLSFSKIIDLHFLIYKAFYSIIGSLMSGQYQILRVINFSYLLLIVFITYKIIKLKFYDLDLWNPIVAFLISGGILFSFLTIQGFLLSGLLNLFILYFLFKTLEENKITNIISLNIFSLIALLMGNLYCLVIITVLSIIKLINFNLEKEKRLSIISNISFLYIVAIALLIINQLDQEKSLLNIHYSLKLILERLTYIIPILLPLTGTLLIAFCFNIFKKINWNRDLLFFLLIIIISITVFTFSEKMNLGLLVFTLPLISIYIFRTLEFVQMKWTKLIYLSLFIIPILIIYTDTSFYLSIEDISFENYFFYAGIILFSLFNPIFFIQAQSIIEIHKTALFSFIMMLSMTASFFYYKYNDQLMPNVIAQTLENELKCSMEKSKLKINDNKSPLLSLYFEDNMYLNFEPECNIQLTFTSLTDLPIDDINSVNKTTLDLNQKSFININFKKL